MRHDPQLQKTSQKQGPRGDIAAPNKISTGVVFVAEGTKENSWWTNKHTFPEGFSFWKSSNALKALEAILPQTPSHFLIAVPFLSARVRSIHLPYLIPNQFKSR